MVAPMRVAIDCRYIRERPSGIGAYVHGIVSRMPELAPDAHFRLWKSPLATGPLSTARNTTEVEIHPKANSLPTTMFPARLDVLKDVDLFHQPSNVMGRGIPCPSVVTIHDLMWLRRPALCAGLSPVTPFQYAYFRDGITRALREARRLICISQATADDVVAMAPLARERVRVIHHGIEPLFAPPKDRAQAESEGRKIVGFDEPYFLVVGQNSPSKYHRGVLEAFAQAACKSCVRLVLLQRLYAKGQWWVMGTDRLDRVAERLSLGDRVVSLPRLSNEDVVRLLQGALALVQFSKFEGFGMPLLEAMACGTPAIASDIAPLREVSGGAAVHVPLEIDNLTRALDRVASTPALCAELSARGIERSRDFRWERAAEQTLEVYREACA